MKPVSTTPRSTASDAAALIPAYQPDEKLLSLSKALLERGLSLTVVNDGSTKGLEVFEKLKELPGVTVLAHPENQGKGAALKTGLSYLWGQGTKFVVTADADGQHLPDDILRVLEAARQAGGTLVLGVRNVQEMPKKSKLGNTMTRFLFKALYGIRLTDTQTGLRAAALTEELVAGLCAVSGDRYEYEMEVLKESRSLFPNGIKEVPIETVYLDQNRTSHFQPLRDGLKVWKVLFVKFPKFLLSSFSAFLLDYALFNVIYYLLCPHEMVATAAARVVSSTYNYLVNKYLVFGRESSGYKLRRFVLLAAAVLAVNMLLMRLFVKVLGLPAFLIKPVVDALLYFISFTVQNRFANEKQRKQENE